MSRSEKHIDPNPILHKLILIEEFLFIRDYTDTYFWLDSVGKNHIVLTYRNKYFIALRIGVLRDGIIWYLYEPQIWKAFIYRLIDLYCIVFDFYDDKVVQYDLFAQLLIVLVVVFFFGWRIYYLINHPYTLLVLKLFYAYKWLFYTLICTH